jgi:hypothetical protein
LRGCTPHFKALGKEKSSILGVNQTATDLNEQQLKVLRLGDSSFSAHQYVECAGQEHSVVLGPGDVMYHPAGTMRWNSAPFALTSYVSQAVDGPFVTTCITAACSLFSYAISLLEPHKTFSIFFLKGFGIE